MSLFRPVNSAESNLFTIRLSFGVDSILGNFNNLDGDYTIASNNSSFVVNKDYLSSPSHNNLPINFSCKYISSSKSFQVLYGKKFTQQPNITVTPHLGFNSFAIPTISKKSINGILHNLEIYFFNSSGTTISPSTDGTTGILGFDLEITGPVKLGQTTGNSNKGWSLNDTTTNEPSVYTFMDLNLGSGKIVNNSVVISKNLKLLNNDGKTKKIESATVLDLTSNEYVNTVWELGTGGSISNLIPQIGMLLIIMRTGESNSTVTLGLGSSFNNDTNITKLTFSSKNSSVILYAPTVSTFIVLSSNGTVNTSN